MTTDKIIQMGTSTQLQAQRSALEGCGALMNTGAQSVISVKSVVSRIVF